MRDALFKSVLFDKDAPVSEGAQYPEKKRRVLDLVPQGGDWRDLPEDVAKDYMGGSWHLGGGKTGMARRLSLDEPSLTLTCSPCQKQTERCHPLETRPLNVREYARIQTFPDYWQFQGSMNEKYKQIGNAVPVNLAWAVGRSLIRLFNDIQTVKPEKSQDCSAAVKTIIKEQSLLVQVKDLKTQTSTVKKKTCKQLDLFELFQKYALDSIMENDMAHEPICAEYGALKKDGHSLNLHENVLISLVKKDNEQMFVDGFATIYYTGRKFPSTVALNHLYYFMPYIKGKGVRDLFLIKAVRLGCRKEESVEENKDDLRLVFEIEHICQLFDEFKPTDLKIWRTYTDTTLEELIKS